MSHCPPAMSEVALATVWAGVAWAAAGGTIA